jgi:hypothetical protein
VVNAATGGIVTFKASGQTGVSIAVGETAFVYFNGTDYVKVVGTATAGAAGGSNTQVQFNSSGVLAGSSNMTFNGTTLTVNDLTDSSLTATRVVYAGASGNLVDSANLTFDGTTLTANALTVTNAVTLSGGTANGVAYLNGSKVVTSGSALTFDGTTLSNSVSGTPLSLNRTGAGTALIELKQSGTVGSYIGTSGSSDVIFFNGSASELMRLNGTGLGIGTSSPAAKLDVLGASAGATVSQFTSNETGTTTSLAVFQRSGGAVAAAIKYNATNSPLTIDFGTTTSHALTFLTANTERARIDSSGNFMVGTTSATRFIDFEKNQNASTILRVGNTTSGTGAYSALQLSSSTTSYLYNFSNAYTTSGIFVAGATVLDAGGSGGLLFNAASVGILFNTGSTERVRIDSSGNVGIGTSSPSTYSVAPNLVVAASGGGGMTIRTSNASYGGVFFADGTTGDEQYRGFVQYNHNYAGVVDSLLFGTAGVGRMTLDSSGNLGIGTSSPSQRLALQGSSTTYALAETTGTGTSSGFRMKAGASSDYTLYTTQGVNQFSIYDNVASADRLTISSSGNVGISTTTPAAKLHIAVADAAVDGTKGVRITNPAGTIVVLECGVSSDSFVGTTSGSDFSIRSNNIERLKFPNAGGVQAVTTISVGNATPSASGAGITFPATQSASSNANTLDDYEEGTWTPNQGSGLTVVGTFQSAGYYTKIGNLVTITGYVRGTTSVACAAAGIICTNAPFAGAVAGIFWVGSVINWSADSGASCAVQQDTSNIYNGTAVTASDRLSFSITYRAA